MLFLFPMIMNVFPHSIKLPDLKQVIDRSPVTVSLKTPLKDVIAQMGQTPTKRYKQSHTDSSIHANLQDQIPSSCVLIMDESRLVGIFTERDVFKLAASGMNWSELKIFEGMTQPVITLTLSDSVTALDALELFRQHPIHHLPVLNTQQQVVGVITPDFIYRTGSLQVLDSSNIEGVPNHTFEFLGLLSPEGTLLEANQSALNFVGATKADVIGRPFWETPWWTSSPDSQTKLRRAIAQAAAGELARCEVTHRRASGRLETLDFSISPMIDKTGKVIFLIPEGREISDRKQMELQLRSAQAVLEQQVQQRTQELAETNRRLRQEISERKRQEAERKQAEEQRALQASLLNQVRNAVLSTDLEGRVTYWNEFAQQLYQLTPEDMGRSILEVTVPVKHQEIAQEIMASIQATGSWEGEFEVQRRDGSRFIAYVLDALIRDQSGNPCGIVGVSMDISERKRQEAERKQVEAERQQLLEQSLAASTAAETARTQVTMILESITDGFIALNHDGQFIYVNQRGAQILQRNAEELIGQNVWEILPDAVHTGFYPHYHRVMAERTKVVFEEFYTPLNIWFEVHAYPTPEGLIAYFQDITQRKQAEQKIYEQAALLNITSDAIFVRDLGHHILYWNQGAERLYGWPAAEAIGQKANELLQEDACQVSKILETVLNLGEWRGELRKVTKSGQEVIVEGRWTLVRDEAGQPKSILTVNTDITEKKQLEAQFLRAQRLESLGTLASGIAHDLNNILTPMLAIAPLLPLNLPPLSERSQKLLKMMEENAKRGAELVKQILTFARGLEGERAPVQVKHLLRELEQVIRSTFPKSITIRRHIATQDLWLVSANATQLHQVFMNFCVNARDAMPEGGTLTISAENRIVDQIYTQMNLEAKEGSYVVITFADTGIGIVPENIDRIFEPFFTTKGVGEGTGLGLSTVLGIIKNHGGFVTVSSEVGQGTEFQVFLPAIAGTEPPVARAQELPMGQGELILIVDDEVNIRETLKITLENQNYCVLTAKDGIEAIATCAKHREDIKVVLMDMMMPSMDGSAAIHALQMLNSQIKIIACSGLIVRDPALEVGVKAFLAKPFSTDVLLNTLHRVLREAP